MNIHGLKKKKKTYIQRLRLLEAKQNASKKEINNLYNKIKGLSRQIKNKRA